jgi:hypothetical protein
MAAEGAARWFVIAQVIEAVARCAEAEAQAEVARRMRDEAIRRAKAEGLTLAELAAISGLSRARIQQLAPEIHAAAV